MFKKILHAKTIDIDIKRKDRKSLNFCLNISKTRYNYKKLINYKLPHSRLMIISVSGHEAKCKCSCGNIKTINIRSIYPFGNTRSCGCLNSDRGIRRIKNAKMGAGVHWHKYAKKWVATLDNRVLGYFDAKDDAIATRLFSQTVLK